VTSDSTDVIAYSRGGALVLVNARDSAARFAVTGFAVSGARDLLSGRMERGDTVSLLAYGALVLERQVRGPKPRTP